VFTNHPFDNYGSHTISLFSSNQDRDRSRAAAERYFLLQSLPERRRAARAGTWSGLRRLLTASVRTTQTGRVEA
jgi:hypothetical protein